VLFRRLAVFVGGGTLEAAEAVCAAPEGVAPLALDLLEGLTTLVDHSLVQPREEGGEPRFGMLQVIREYALERMEASGEAEALRRAHAAAVLALAEKAEPELTGPAAGAWLDRLEREHDNLRATLGWAREQGEAETGLRLVAALRLFWMGRGYLREGRAWVEGLLALGSGAASGPERAVAPRVWARALHAGGMLTVWQGDFAVAQRWLEEATALGRAAGDLRAAARALNTLGILALNQGDPERAGARFADSLALVREAGDQRGIAAALNNLGDIAYYQSDLERAAAAYTEALALFREVGDRQAIAIALRNLGAVARRRGEVAQAAALLREGLALVWDLDDLRGCAGGMEELASTAGAVGQGERAARLLGAAEALRETLGAPLPHQEQADVEQAVAAARAALGEEAWTAAFAAGRALSPEQAIAEALGEARSS
jgi:non-specific serine/threonine protein kinase